MGGAPASRASKDNQSRFVPVLTGSLAAALSTHMHGGPPPTLSVSAPPTRSTTTSPSQPLKTLTLPTAVKTNQPTTSASAQSTNFEQKEKGMLKYSITRSI